MNHLSVKGKFHQQGLSIIEVLVAMLILSVGLLGMASLQVRAVQDTTNSSFRSIAIYYANDMVDRMRANSAELNSGSAFNSALDNNGDPTGSVAVPSTNPGNSSCASSGCSSAAMAQQDMYDWSQNVSAALPAGQGSVGVSGGVYTVTVAWTDRVNATGTNSDGDQANQSSVSLSFTP